MSLYAEFLREVEKRVGERVAELTNQVVAGGGITTIEAYREKVGELRAYATLTEILEDAARVANQRSTKD